MAIASPSQPVYYYEVSAGRFRLVYFIPPEELERLHGEDLISAEALEDFPDGVDLDCTTPDFNEFDELYGYRPECDPEALGRAFFAILSATSEWQETRASGFIPAGDLEGRIDSVDAALRDRDVAPTDAVPIAATASVAERRQQMGTRAARQAQLFEALEEIPVDGIDPGRKLGAQQFSDISWSEGDPAEKAFVRLHRKQKS